MSVAPPSGTITFLFTDIEGSTRLWLEYPDQMQHALARHDALLRLVLAQHDGYLVKATGDGIHAAFTTAPQAIDAVLDAQRALLGEAWGPETPIRVRMGLHTGVAEERDGDYYGTVPNRAARLTAAAHGGQILLSAATQELVRDHLPDGASLRILGETRLKDLGRPEQVYQLCHPDLPTLFPSLRSLDNPALPNNLPQQVTSFVGRIQETAEVKALLKQSRLLTLTGMGGAGKSRLSLQVAADLLIGDGDGVWLVELAPVADPALVPKTVADALGVGEEPDRPILETLLAFLKTKRLLLVLDNCEHLLAACAAFAAALLRTCPTVSVLASSREPLGVPGEQTYRVPPLSLPDLRRKQTVAGLSQYEAVRLFIERSHLVQPAFSVTDENAPAVAQVCWRLDGIPLALELAAARLRTLTVEEINTRLDDRFRLLTGGARTLLPRQQTLRALVDWSYDLLDVSEQTALQRLSVFRGGWTLPAAEAVCAGEAMEAWDVLDPLTSLCDKSLVVAEAQGDSTRYRLLETLREYASERLRTSGEDALARSRHRDFFLELAEEASPKLVGLQASVWVARVEAEYDNLRAALDWCLGEEGIEGAVAGLRLSGAMGRYWQACGALTEGRARMGATLTRPGAEEPTSARAWTLRWAALLALFQGDYTAARAEAEEALALFRQFGDPRGMGWALVVLGNAAAVQGMPGESHARFEEALPLFHAAGDQAGVGSTINNIGNLLLAAGDLTGAEAHYEEALSINRAAGNGIGVQVMLTNLGSLAYHRRDLAEARRWLEESLALQIAMGNRADQIAYTLAPLAQIAIREGRFAEARDYLREGLTTCRESGDKPGGTALLETYGFLRIATGHAGVAARLLGAAWAQREAFGISINGDYRADYDELRAEIQAGQSEAEFAAAFAGGEALSWDQAMSEALTGITTVES